MSNENSGEVNQEIALICRLINERLGFAYGPHKEQLVRSRLERRLRELKLSDYRAYIQVLKRDPQEVNRLYTLLTTNVTSFFRGQNQLQILEQELLPVLIAKHQTDRKIRCWSAGCSSGEEAYTLALILQEALGSGWDFKILASDIDVVKLREGMAGIYSTGQLAEIPKQLRQKYFRPLLGQPEYFKIHSRLRHRVIFKQINLIEEHPLPPGTKLDLIICRNVFIYFAREPRQQVLESFHDHLASDGYLLLGHSELLESRSDPHWQLLKSSIYQKLELTGE